MGLFTIWFEEDDTDKEIIGGSDIDSDCCEPEAVTEEADDKNSALVSGR